MTKHYDALFLCSGTTFGSVLLSALFSTYVYGAMLPPPDGTFSSHDSVAGTCHFRLLAAEPGVCQVRDLKFKDKNIASQILVSTNGCFSEVRVDFVDTELLSPTEGDCVDQYLVVRSHGHSSFIKQAAKPS